MGTHKIMTGWKRLLALQQRARDRYLSGVLIHRPENIYYFASVYPLEPCFLVLPSDGEPELVAARSALAEAQRDSLVPVTAGELDIAGTAYERMLNKKMLKHPGDTLVKNVLRKVSESPIGLEMSYLSLFLFKYFNISNYQDITSEINAMREIKDSFEIEFITRACRIADQALEHTREKITLGMPEKELSGIFQAQAKALGAEESKCRVRSGENTAMAFSRWMDGNLDHGPLLVEYGASVRGYWSDMTRMFYLGSEPDGSFLEIYNLVLQARNNALEHMHQGQSIFGPEARIREVFREKGLEQNMIYTAGHGIGLEIHEEPLLGSPPAPQENREDTQPSLLEKSGMGSSFMTLAREMKSEATPAFQKNHVVALEPGLFFSHLGVSVKDVVLIRDKPGLLSTLSTDPGDMVVYV